MVYDSRQLAGIKKLFDLVQGFKVLMHCFGKSLKSKLFPFLHICFINRHSVSIFQEQFYYLLMLRQYNALVGCNGPDAEDSIYYINAARATLLAVIACSAHPQLFIFKHILGPHGMPDEPAYVQAGMAARRAAPAAHPALHALQYVDPCFFKLFLYIVLFHVLPINVFPIVYKLFPDICYFFFQYIV